MTSSENTRPGETEPSFEEAYTQLGQTVQSLESGNLSIEAATKLYEEGMRLVQLCSRRLSDAELKVTQLQAAYSSSLAEDTGDGLFEREEPPDFDVEDEE